MNRDILLQEIRDAVREDYGIESPFADVALTVSGGATPTVTSSEVECDGASRVFVVINNKGASTDLTAKIYKNYKIAGAYDTVPTKVINLANGEQTSVEIPAGFFGLKVKLENNDATNATTVDVDCRMSK